MEFSSEEQVIEPERAKPRLRPINRQQLVMWSMNVEQLVPENHEVLTQIDFI
jgi:hypothetical protein